MLANIEATPVPTAAVIGNIEIAFVFGNLGNMP